MLQPRMAYLFKTKLLSFTVLIHIFSAGARAEDAAPETLSENSNALPRLERAEARLQELEHLLKSSGLLEDVRADIPASESSSALSMSSRLEGFEHRLARIESAVEAQLSNADSEGKPAAQVAEQSADSRSEVSDYHATYLPSRGTAGGPLHYGEPDRRLSLHAFLDLEYIDAGPDGSRSGVSTFDNHHANLFVRSEIRPDLIGHMEVEYEHSGDVVEIDQAFLAWAATDWLTFRGGRFYTPFGIERFVWYSPTNALVSRPVAMRQIIPGNFYANGLELSGILGPRFGRRFTYEVALTDGLGDDALVNRRGSRQSRDNNSSRALSGRLGYAFNTRVEVGASYHEQRYSTDEDLDLAFFGLDFAGRWQGWEIRAEWVQADLEDLVFDDGGLPVRSDLDQAGWYAQVAYTFLWDRSLLPELRLVTRYDEVDLDKALIGNDDQEFLSLGVNLSVVEHLRAKVEYQFASEEGPSLDDDTFRFQLVLDY